MGNRVSRNSFNPEAEMLDMHGKVVIVTGANKGIGYSTVQFLLKAGAKVYLGARDEKRAKEALAQFAAEGYKTSAGEDDSKNADAQVVWLKVDLSDPREAKKAAEAFLKKETRLDVLVNNAGLVDIFGEQEIGPDGVSTMVIVNYISPFVFTNTLLPLMQQTAAEPDSDVRIVNVTSVMHKMVPGTPKYESLEDLNVSYKGKLLAGSLRYGHSKLMMVLWTKALQRRLNLHKATLPIIALSLHPGGVDTYSANWPAIGRIPFKALYTVTGTLIPQDMGAWNSIFAAAGKTVKEDREKYMGVYLEEKPAGSVVEPHKAALDEELGENLWKVTEEFVRKLE